jgi:hypothetical protein
MDTYMMEMSICFDNIGIDMLLSEHEIFINSTGNNTILVESALENIKNKFIEIWNKIVEKIKKMIKWFKEKIFKKITEAENKIKQNINNMKKSNKESMKEIIRHCESRFPYKTGSYDYHHKQFFIPIINRMSTANKWKIGDIDDDEMEDNINQLRRIIDDLKEYDNNIKNGTDNTVVIREYNDKERGYLIDDITKINDNIRSDSQKIHNDLDQINSHNKTYELILKDFNKEKGEYSKYKIYTQYLTLLLQSFSSLINTMSSQSENNYELYMYNFMILNNLSAGSDMEGEKFRYKYDN